MIKPTPTAFTHAHTLQEDGSISFSCSSDKTLWPWLALPPDDPIVVQCINYWASVECTAYRGTQDPAKWTALTRMDWTSSLSGTGHATRGIAGPAGPQDAAPRYGLTFFDAAGEQIYRMTGAGVTFRTRNFEAWRDKAKKSIAPAALIDTFEYAPADHVGVETQAESFLSPLIQAGTPHALGLITKQNGLLPGHPYIDGSGDHVNSTHFGDIARQFTSLVCGGTAPAIISGGMKLTHYVELGVPFQVTLVEHSKQQSTVSMTLHQADHLCASLRVGYAERARA